MPEIRELGRMYFHHLRVRKDTQLIHKAPTTEIDIPWRTGVSTIIRLWPTSHAIAVGRWTRELGEEEALLRALAAHEEECFDQHGALLDRYGRGADDAPAGAEGPPGADRGHSEDRGSDGSGDHSVPEDAGADE